MHRRMVWREPDRRLVLAQIAQPQRLPTEDDLAQQALPLGQRAHPRPCRLVQADVDEPRDAAVRGEDAERSEPGVNEVHRGLHNALERGVQLHAVGDGEDGVEQSLHAATGRHDLGEPLLHFAAAARRAGGPTARPTSAATAACDERLPTSRPPVLLRVRKVRTNTSTVSRPRCAHNSREVSIGGEMPVARRKGPFARSPHHLRGDRVGGQPPESGGMQVTQGPTGTRDPPRIPAAFGLTAPEIEGLLATAGRAPSLHNSQPWQFRVTPRAIELHADPRRSLVVADPDGRELRIACGAALFNLQLALHGHGIRPIVTILPDRARPGLLAAVRHGGTKDPTPEQQDLLRAVASRRTEPPSLHRCPRRHTVVARPAPRRARRGGLAARRAGPRAAVGATHDRGPRASRAGRRPGVPCRARRMDRRDAGPPRRGACQRRRRPVARPQDRLGAARLHRAARERNGYPARTSKPSP